MIVLSEGSMFDRPASVWINTVNCVGPWGKGIALACKTRFPDAFAAYTQHLRTAGMRPGQIFPWRLSAAAPAWLVSIATKDHWRDPSQLEWVVDGALAFRTWLETQPDTTTVAMPALGCGNGGLLWSEVSPLLQHLFKRTPNTIWLFPPHRETRYAHVSR